jgi:phosphatidylcholine synthase
MDVHAPVAQPSRSRVLAGLVHAYTAVGAVLAFVGVRAVLRKDERLAFMMMFAATLVDSTDGVLARLARVKEVLPKIDGARIDDIVDYITFVFLPLLLLERAGGLPSTVALPVVAIVLIASAFGFAATDAKTADHFFTGFPSYWNIVVLYLYVFKTAPLLNAVLLVLLSALIFLRVGFIYPSRTRALRGLTLTLGITWGILVALLIWTLPDPPRWAAILSLVFPVYYFVASLILHARRRRVPAA